MEEYGDLKVVAPGKADQWVCQDYTLCRPSWPLSLILQFPKAEPGTVYHFYRNCRDPGQARVVVEVADPATEREKVINEARMGLRDNICSH